MHLWGFREPSELALSAIYRAVTVYLRSRDVGSTSRRFLDRLCLGKNAPPPGVARHHLILLVLVVVSGLKVMNELNQLTPTSLRDVVVLERMESIVRKLFHAERGNLPARQLRGVFICRPPLPAHLDRIDPQLVVLPSRARGNKTGTTPSHFRLAPRQERKRGREKKIPFSDHL